jgi:hypothetical protein
MGAVTGLGVGALAGVSRRFLLRLPAPAAIMAIGGTAMALTDGPLVWLGLTEPRKWSRVDWLSDVVPHLAYGAATYATLKATEATREATVVTLTTAATDPLVAQR